MKTVIFAILFVVFLYLLFYSRLVVIISLIGIGMGVLMAPVLSFFRRNYNVPRALSAFLLLLLMLIIISGASAAVWYLVSDQLETLSERAPEITEKLKSQLS
jgi:predicted PurR-regulated permease PerM